MQPALAGGWRSAGIGGKLRVLNRKTEYPHDESYCKVQDKVEV